MILLMIIAACILFHADAADFAAARDDAFAFTLRRY